MQDWSVDHSPESDPEAPFVASPAAAGTDDGGAATVPAAATASSEPSSCSSARPEYVRDGTMQRGFGQGNTKASLSTQPGGEAPPAYVAFPEQLTLHPAPQQTPHTKNENKEKKVLYNTVLLQYNTTHTWLGRGIRSLRSLGSFFPGAIMTQRRASSTAPSSSSSRLHISSKLQS